VTAPPSRRLPDGLATEITRSLVSLWTRYAGKAPTAARTEIRGNVVTCVLVDAFGDYNRSMAGPQTRDTIRGAGGATSTAYKREAVAAVARVTRQRVTASISSHDGDTDITTEVFTLEQSLGRGSPARPRRRLGQNLPASAARRPNAAMAER
jgi:Na+-translocating membrane potential-generating system (MpsC)